VERNTAAAPDGRAAAETALPVAVGLTVHARVGDAALIESLRCLLRVHSPGLDEEDPKGTARQLQRESDSGRPGAHYADVGLELLARSQFQCIVDHECGPS